MEKYLRYTLAALMDQPLSCRSIRKPPMIQRVYPSMRSLFLKIIYLSLFSLLLSGCEAVRNFSFTDPNKDEYVEYDAERFHREATEAMEDGYYAKAIKLYENLETRYPFGQYAAQTQLDLAYAYYKNDEPEAAIAAAERFIKVHPRNPHVDYAYYLIGLVNYNRGFGFLERFMPIDTSQRDPANTLVAYNNFEDLVKRFPDSKYGPDSKKRMTALRNTLAMHEVHVARFYIDREAYVAAAKRANYVVEHYQRTPAVPYALLVMKQAYDKLGLQDLANDTERVYNLNYPDGPPVPEVSQSSFAHKVWDFLGFDK